MYNNKIIYYWSVGYTLDTYYRGWVVNKLNTGSVVKYWYDFFNYDKLSEENLFIL